MKTIEQTILESYLVALTYLNSNFRYDQQGQLYLSSLRAQCSKILDKDMEETQEIFEHISINFKHGVYSWEKCIYLLLKEL